MTTELSRLTKSPGEQKVLEHKKSFHVVPCLELQPPILLRNLGLRFEENVEVGRYGLRTVMY
jgi:hypothetical protein